jgi:uncharacterized hydrophobic protein (TIGR00271 family)
MKVAFKINVSNERAFAVYEEIARGSRPESRFYTMVAASTAIAALGLIMNSTAVVIGAMLVAPLMTPIFGIALALVRGDTTLLWQAIRAEIAGVLLTVSLGCLFGFAMPEFEATQEMLSRTSPNLLDLFVAIFAGFAGAYAMVDEHISPALPGVAIATAIVPPLANSGLCIALGAYSGAMSSFLLFLANLLSILLVAAAIFMASKMGREFESITKIDVARRFGLAAFVFLIIAIVLSKGLYDMVQARHFKRTIDSVLKRELSHLTATELRKVVHHKQSGKIYILAHVHASGDIQPSRVKLMEKAIEDEVEKPVELFVRSTLSKDISATGSTNQVITESLDGFSLSQETDPRIKIVKQSEQAIREYLETQLGMYMEEINLLPISGKPVILVSIFGVRKLSSEEIGKLESEIRSRTGKGTLYLVVRHIKLDLYDQMGKAYVEWGTYKEDTSEHDRVFNKIRSLVTAELENSGYFLTNFNLTIRTGIYHVLIEMTGNKLYSHVELMKLRKKISTMTGKIVQVYARSKPEVVLTEKGFTSFDKLQEMFFKQSEILYQKQISQSLNEGL